MSSDSGKTGPKGAGGRVALYLGLLVLVGSAAFVRWAVTREAGVTWEEAPPETRGVWTTTDARYAGRAIEVGAQTVNLRLGQGDPIPGRLTIAREVFDDDTRILRLEYETQAGPDALDMVVAADGSMSLRNQPGIVWHIDASPGYRPPPTVTVPENRTDFMPLLIGGLLVLLLVVALWALLRSGVLNVVGERAPSSTVPKLVRGVWTTPDPRYEGHSIRIAYEYGFAQFGPGDVRIGGEITDVRRYREEGDQVVALTYRTRDGVDQDLSMVIDKTGHMRLKDGPRSIWVRR